MDPTAGLASGVFTVTAHATVRQAAELMHAHGVGDVIVMDNHRPVGILTDRDIVIRVAATGLNPRRVSVQDVMSSPLITAPAENEVSEAVALMRRHGIRRLPILDREGRLCSILTLDDLIMLGVADQQLGDIVRHQLKRGQTATVHIDARSADTEKEAAFAGVAPPLGRSKTWVSPATHRLFRRNRHWFFLVGMLSLLAAAAAWILTYFLTPPG